MEKKWLVIGAVAGLAIALVALLEFGVFVPGPYSQEYAKIVQSNSYWQGSATPFAVLRHLVNGSNEEMTMVLQNVQGTDVLKDELTLTGISAKFDATGDSIAVAKGLPLKFKPGETKTVELTRSKKAIPGEWYEIAIEFAYKDQNGKEMKQFGARPLVGKFA